MRLGVRVVALTLVALSLLGVPLARAQEQRSDQWAVALEPTSLYAQPSESADVFGRAAAYAPLQILRYDGEFAYVYNPRTRGTAFVLSSVLAPSEQPSRYVLMPAPPVTEELAERGVVIQNAALAVYPSEQDEAALTGLRPSTWLNLDGLVTGEDGTPWYRTTDGWYVPADAIFVPTRGESFGGRWLDVDLTSPARVTAYEGGEPAATFLAIKGTATFPTPTGIFTIMRRVANETMNSDTIGIPRFGPGGYYLTNVLFTQYFTSTGASFHYNYWSGNWGLPGSHGCLGLTYADSAFLWEWAQLGTPVSIHY